MVKITEEQLESTKESISSVLNETGAYTKIQEVVKKELGVDIGNDDEFWHNIEELILDEIVENYIDGQ